MKISSTVLTLSTLLYVLSSPVMGMDKKGHEGDKPKGVPMTSPVTVPQGASETSGQSLARSSSLQPAPAEPDKAGGSDFSSPRWAGDQSKLLSEFPTLLKTVPAYAKDVEAAIRQFTDSIVGNMEALSRDFDKPIDKRVEACMSVIRYHYSQGKFREMTKLILDVGMAPELCKKYSSAEVQLYYVCIGAKADILLGQVSKTKKDMYDYYKSFESISKNIPCMSFHYIVKAQKLDPDICALARFHMAEMRVKYLSSEDIQCYLKTAGGDPFEVMDDPTAYGILGETRGNTRLPSWVQLQAQELMQKMVQSNRAPQGENPAGKEGKPEKKADGQA